MEAASETAGGVEMSDIYLSPSSPKTTTASKARQQSPSIKSRASEVSKKEQQIPSTSSQVGGSVVRSKQELTQKELDNKPWKYIGYRGYTSYLASETDFLIFRRFGGPSTRIALMLQDRVANLEEQLEMIDNNYERRECEDMNNGTFRDDDVNTRKAVLVELKKALDEYYTFMLQQAELKKLPPPAKHDIVSIQNWHYNHETAINEAEQVYLDMSHDLFSLFPRDKSPLRRLLDRSKGFRLLRPWRKKKSTSILPLYDQQEVTYTSDKRVDRFVNLIVVLIGIGMLVGPIWILHGLSGSKEKLATITGFIVLFLVILGGATVAKIWEALAATAAYSAVLMVFMQLGST